MPNLNKTFKKQPKKVVIVGGANGTSLVVRGLKNYVPKIELSAVVAMSDSARSSAVVRGEIGVPAVTDLFRVLLAMSAHDEHYDFLHDLFYKKRFTSPEKLQQLNIGSALLALSAKHTNDLVAVIRGLENIFSSVGRVHPVTLDMTDLHVRLTSGETIVGEGNIDIPEKQYNGVIEEAWLNADGEITPEAREALENADTIIISPGDLFTSNISALLPRGVSDAIAASKAQIVYVAGNSYRIGGEPAPVTLSGRVAALDRYLPRPIDIIFYNSHTLTADDEEFYQKNSWGLIDMDMHALANRRVLGQDIERTGGGICHTALGDILKNLVYGDTNN